MADEPSPGELQRQIDRMDARFASEVQRLEREQEAATRRLQREHAEDLRLLREDVIRPLRTDVDALEKRPGLTAGRWAVIATAVVAVLALAIQAYGTLKGAK